MNHTGDAQGSSNNPQPSSPPQGLPPDDNPPGIPEFVKVVVKNLLPPEVSSPPGMGGLPVATVPPEGSAVLVGYLGDASRYAEGDELTDRDSFRLYRSLMLNEYLEIRNVDILHVTLVSNVTPIAYNVVWVKPNAEVRYVYTATMQVQQASFLQGPIAGTVGGRYVGGGSSGYGGGGGGTSFGCPGSGTSFGCPGGGTSFGCPGGGTSFGCPGSGTSFGCPGGGTSFGCPGGGVSFVWCR